MQWSIGLVLKQTRPKSSSLSATFAAHFLPAFRYLFGDQVENFWDDFLAAYRWPPMSAALKALDPLGQVLPIMPEATAPPCACSVVVTSLHSACLTIVRPTAGCCPLAGITKRQLLGLGELRQAFLSTPTVKGGPKSSMAPNIGTVVVKWDHCFAAAVLPGEQVLLRRRCQSDVLLSTIPHPTFCVVLLVHS